MARWQFVARRSSYGCALFLIVLLSVVVVCVSRPSTRRLIDRLGWISFVLFPRSKFANNKTKHERHKQKGIRREEANKETQGGDGRIVILLFCLLLFVLLLPLAVFCFFLLLLFRLSFVDSVEIRLKKSFLAFSSCRSRGGDPTQFKWKHTTAKPINKKQHATTTMNTNHNTRRRR